MKINYNNWIPLIVASLVLAIILASNSGIIYGNSNEFVIVPLGIKINAFWFYVLFWVLIVSAVAIIIDYLLSGLQWVSRIAEQKIKQQTLREDEVKAKIEMLNERSRIIENKIDKIDGILRKVSD
ncbi:MAG: hypothetical protein PHH85_11155 [Candidatus Methanoperedens sp.]|nr:hypothetical protein [Candidatus Methanoperedens sp.]